MVECLFTALALYAHFMCPDCSAGINFYIQGANLRVNYWVVARYSQQESWRAPRIWLFPCSIGALVVWQVYFVVQAIVRASTKSLAEWSLRCFGPSPASCFEEPLHHVLIRQNCSRSSLVFAESEILCWTNQKTWNRLRRADFAGLFWRLY